MDNRPRYYFHGDAHEADTSMHYCIACDHFEPAGHFAVCTSSKHTPLWRTDLATRQFYRWQKSVAAWERKRREVRARYRVMNDPRNLIVTHTVQG